MNLTGGEWAVCIVIGFYALPVGFLARQLPLDIPREDRRRSRGESMEQKKQAARDVNISLGDNAAAKRRWSKVRNVMHAYSAFMAPLTVPVAESRERARGRSLSLTVGDEEEFLAAGLPSPTTSAARTKSTEFRTVSPGSETSINMK